MRSPNTGNELQILEGNAADIVARGNQLTTLATTMDETATQLKSIGDSSVHKSKGTDKLAEMATETATDLSAAATRYSGTGKTLTTYGEALGVANSWLASNIGEVEAAERAYQAALDEKEDADLAASLATSRAAGAEADSAEADALDDAESSASAAATSLTNATTARNEMWSAFDSVFDEWSDAYDAAVDGIEKAIDTAGNNDGFWEFIDQVLNVIAIVLVVLSIIALVIGAPLTGLLGAIIFVLAAASFLLTTLKFAFGRATLSDVAWSAVGLLPFGLGKLLSRGVPTLSSVVQGGRGVVTAAIRSDLPRFSFLRPTTWGTPFRWLFAPVQSARALPKPGMLTNPFDAIRFGGSQTAQTSTFLNTLRSSPYATNPGVQQFVSSTAASLPGAIRQTVNVMAWGGFSTADLMGIFGSQPEIPGLRDVRVG
ncbi:MULTISPECIES: DUF2721 domain-containing protein [unclassified Microbacterium]|uniref:DUF2721 domain-containing protein n=1 Tax=unclassified Microbacterium TaxID=2609290 RepID=UPI00109C7AE8|nr:MULTISPECIES: DUF2721 domain-containing protein [unclassified Microbacterium]